MTPEEKLREEQKRDQNYDPLLRWQHLQEAFAWAEANMPDHLRRNRPQIHKS
jgi:hypothetical protein